MDPALIISPHADDAVLSCGQFMAGRPDCVVATIFLGTPKPATRLTSFDKNCGFPSAGHATKTRRVEDRAALLRLHAVPRHLEYLDNQYRPPGEPWAPIAEQAAVNVAAVVDEFAVTLALGPVGLNHLDHVIAGDVFHRVLLMRPDVEGWLYEDLPSRVLTPELVPGRLDEWRSLGYDLELGFLGTGPLKVKRDAILKYRSQKWMPEFGGPALHNVMVPERFWQMRRRDG